MAAMRIALNHTRFSKVGGVEGYVYLLVRRLLEEGHEVHYFAYKWEPLDHPRLVFHRVPYLKGIPSLKVISFAYLSRWVIGRAHQRTPFDLTHGFSKTFFQDLYTDGSGTLPDYQTYTLSGLGPVRRLWGRCSPHAMAILHTERMRFRSGRLRKTIAMSRMAKEQICSRYGVDEGRIEVLYNGIDTERFHPRNRAIHRAPVRADLGAAPGCPVVLFVGNDYRRKGLAALIRALAMSPRWHLWVIGFDHDENRYRDLAVRLGCGERIRFLGRRRDVDRYLAAADAFSLPSLYDIFGNASTEAMAAGIPTIISTRAGAMEVVTSGKDGFVTAPDDPGAMADALRALEDETVRESMGQRARETAERYSWDSHFTRLREIYREVAEEKGR